MIKIENTKIYGLEESCIASGYPKNKEVSYSKADFFNSIYRSKKLAKAQQGSGHDCFLKGIIVQTDLTAPQFFFQQIQRYHFLDIVSSQSKMHNILSFDFYNDCTEFVDIKIKEILSFFQNEYKKNTTYENFRKVLDNTPTGLLMTARITTNYLQLKTIYTQRKEHKLNEWKIFLEWIENLEKFKELVLGGKE